MPSLLDPTDQTTTPQPPPVAPNAAGAAGGLAGLLSSFAYDPAAAYGGALNDPATQSAFRARALAGAAQAFGAGAMPVPYKGGIPIGATLGNAAAAALGGEDALVAARQQAAQTILQQAQAGNAQAQMMVTKGILEGHQKRPGIYEDADAGTTAAAPGTTGPAKILAGQGKGAGTPFDTGDPFLNLVPQYESKWQPYIGTGGTDLTGKPLDKTGFPIWEGIPVTYNGKKTYSTAAGLFQITGENWHQFAPALIASGAMQPNFSPESQVAVAKAMKAANGTQPWTGTDASGKPWNPELVAAYKRGDVVQVPQTPTAGAPAQPAGPVAGGLLPQPGAPPLVSAAAPGGVDPARDAQMAQRLGLPPGSIVGMPPGPGPAAPGAAPAPPPALPRGVPAPLAPPPGSLLNPPPAAAAPPRSALPPGMAPQPGAPFTPPMRPPVAAPAPMPAGAPPGAGAPPVAMPAPQMPPRPVAPPLAPQGTPAPPPMLAPAGAPGAPPVPAGAPPAPGVPAAPIAPPAAAPAPGAAPGAAAAAAPMTMTPPPPPPAIPEGKKISNAYIAWAKQMSALYTVGHYTVPPDIASAASLDIDMAKADQQARLKAMYDQQTAAYQASLDIAKAGPVAGNTAAAQSPWLQANTAAEQQQRMQRELIVAANAPQKLGPTETLNLAPGSVGASLWQDRRMTGATVPNNVTFNDNGSVVIRGSGQTPEQVTAAQKKLDDLGATAAQSRNGLFQIQQLRTQLGKIGGSGPATAIFSDLGQWATSLGLATNDEVKHILGISPPDEVSAEKLSQDLLGAVLKAQFPGRITNADITAWKNTVPRGTMPEEAYTMLINQVLMPTFERDITRYGSVADLNQADPQLATLNPRLEAWDKAHPYESFIHQYRYGPGGHVIRYDEGSKQWVDNATNPVVR